MGKYGIIGDFVFEIQEVKLGEKMVHPGRFELPTARFVAEYSIQLSYGCIGVLLFASDSILLNLP